MHRLSIIIVIFSCIAAFAKVIPILPTGSSLAPEIRFTENKGQWAGYIKTKAEVSGGEMYLSGNAFCYHFIDYEKLHEITHGHHSANDSMAGTILKVAFVNADKAAKPIYSNPYPDYQNYFLGNNSADWHPKVYSYQNIKVENFYPNIDLELTSKGQDLKYDLVAKPNADLSKIAIKYSGQKNIRLQNGLLYIETAQARLTELKPIAYQTINGQKRTVSCNYVLDNEQVTFKIGSTYDPNYSLVIDPQIVFSSYSGSRADNFGYTATFDQDGNTYVGGVVYNYDPYTFLINGEFISGSILFPKDSFPASLGAYKTKFQGGVADIVIFKFSKDGKRRQYATYLGGNGTETPHSMVVNKDNQLIIMGATSSANYPLTPNVYATTGSGTSFQTNTNELLFIGGSQLLLTILNETGSGLVASNVIRTNGNSAVNSTRLAAKPYYNFGDEFRGEVICDTADNSITVATYTTTTLIPTETTPKIKSSTDSLDAWILKINANLSQLIFSKRFGGSGIDVAYGLQPDSRGNLFFAGHTNSTDLLGTLTGLNTSIKGNLDGYIAKMDKNGNILAATYLGTPADDQAFFVQTDLANNVYVMGQTWSNAYPTVANGISPFWSNTGSGQFIHKLNNSLTGTLFSTVFGSGVTGPDISPTAFLVDNCGLIYVSGWRGSLTDVEIPGSPSRRLPLADQLPYNPSSATGFYFGVFGKNMQGIIKGTYFGNDGLDHVDGGTSRFDKRGYIHQAICGGCRGTNVTPTTLEVWSDTNRSFNCNMLGVKFDFETVDIKANFTSIPPLKNDTIKLKVGQSIKFDFTGNSISGANVSWYNYRYPSSSRNNLRFINEEKSWTALSGSPLPTEMSLRKWLIEVDYAKSEDCIQSDNQTFYVVIEPSITGANICNGDSGQFNIIGKVKSSKWIPVYGLSNPDIKNPKVFVNKDTAYVVEVWANDNSYFGRYPAKVKVVNYSPKAHFEFLSDTIGTFPLTIATDNQSATISNRYLWDMGDGNQLTDLSPAYTYNKIGRYTIKLKVIDDSTSCQFLDSTTRRVYVTPKINEVTYCPEKPIGLFTVLGGTLCLFNINGKNISGCLPIITFTGANNPTETIVQVYSEPNKPYSYVFTITAKSNTFPKTTFEYDTTLYKDWNSTLVEFKALTKVKTKTWDVGTGKTYKDSIVTVQYEKAGTYPIIISGADTNGCAYRTERTLEIEFMLIPNVFTPNGDGVNEAFEIRGLKQGTGTLEVFNRWGTKVYESGENNYANNWKADSQTDGLYYYNFKLKYRPEKPYKGWVQVVR